MLFAEYSGLINLKQLCKCFGTCDYIRCTDRRLVDCHHFYTARFTFSLKVNTLRPLVLNLMYKKPFRIFFIFLVFSLSFGQVQVSASINPCDDSAVSQATNSAHTEMQHTDEHNAGAEGACCDVECCAENCVCAGSLCSANMVLASAPNLPHYVFTSHAMYEEPFGNTRPLVNHPFRPPIFTS